MTAAADYIRLSVVAATVCFGYDKCTASRKTVVLDRVLLCRTCVHATHAIRMSSLNLAGYEWTDCMY